MADNELAAAKNEKSAPTKALSLLSLTARNRKFIALIFQGLSTVDAYRGAGYKGADHTAYELRVAMKPFIEQFCEANGLDKAGLMVDLGRLSSLPVRDVNGNALTFVTLNQKLKLMKAHGELVNASKSSPSTITAIVIGRGSDGKATVSIPAGKVQDAEVVAAPPIPAPPA